MSDPAIPVLIYGTCNWTRLLLDEMENDPRYRVEAFVCDPEYLDSSEFHGYPLYAFPEIERRFPPERYFLFACGVYASPRERAGYYLRAKRKNYRCPNFISAKAVVSSAASFGENNFVFGGAYVSPGCRFENNSIVRPNVYVGHDSEIGDTVFFAPGCNVAGHCRIGDLSMLGIGSTLIGGLTVGKEVLIGAGALLTSDAPDFGKYLGVPARRTAEIDPERGIRMDK